MQTLRPVVVDGTFQLYKIWVKFWTICLPCISDQNKIDIQYTAYLLD